MAVVPDVYQLKIALDEIDPPIWRRFLIRSDVKLTRLHDILQIVMGWEDYHLYIFKAGKDGYADRILWEDEWYDFDLIDARKTRLSDVLTRKGSKLRYTYDLGDSWEHMITLEKILDPEPGRKYPVFLDGARACPPEDCGGSHGYINLLEVLSDPEHEEYDEFRAWAGEDFDPETLDRHRIIGTLPRRVIIKEDGSVTKPPRERNSRRSEQTSNTWMINLRHFLADDGLPPLDAPQELLDLLSFLGDIVKAGSLHPMDSTFCSAKTCRSERSGNRCGSNVMISHRPDGVIHWRCVQCQENGYISNWQETDYDFAALMESDADQLPSIHITDTEYGLLSKIITTSRQEDAIIAGAALAPRGVRLSGSTDGFDLLICTIAFEANHTDNVKRRRQLHSILAKIERILERS